MDRKVFGLLGAAAALVSLDSAQAANAPSPDPTEVLRAGSYADLLNPIPNALATLKAVDAAQPAPSASDEELVAQFFYHHHHHHHHRYYPRYYHHHHHHHHLYYRRYYYGPRYHHHHHHHHHHRYFWPYRGW